MGYRTTTARYVAKFREPHTCACVKQSREGRIAPFWGAADLPDKVSGDIGCRSDSIAILRDMGLNGALLLWRAGVLPGKVVILYYPCSNGTYLPFQLKNMCRSVTSVCKSPSVDAPCLASCSLFRLIHTTPREDKSAAPRNAILT